MQKIVQQHEWNEHLGLFINARYMYVATKLWCYALRKMSVFLNISFDMWPTMHPLLEITIVIADCHIATWVYTECSYVYTYL